MNYIRTNEGIFEDAGYDALGLRCVCYKVRKIELSQDDKIVKEADNIVELCDYVFLFDEELTIRKITHEDDESLIEWLKECVELGMKGILAILTDKGLIYAAKMYEKGELKLL